MKFTKQRGDDSTIRKVYNDDKSVLYGVVGTVGDLLKANILEYCNYHTSYYCFLSAPGSGKQDRFGTTREAATALLH